jgi:hypothetical protein
VEEAPGGSFGGQRLARRPVVPHLRQAWAQGVCLPRVEVRYAGSRGARPQQRWYVAVSDYSLFRLFTPFLLVEV